MMTDTEMMTCSEKGRQMERLRAIMHRLRAPGGCPWDMEQTHESLLPNLIEEAYEVLDAVRRDDTDDMREELGDLLLQVVFHSELGEEAGRFDFDEVAREVSGKLVRRHPHVFAPESSDAESSDEVLTQWEQIKREEKIAKGEDPDAVKPFLKGVGVGLPATLRSEKLQKKAAKVGFDWPTAMGVVGKIDEELGEVKEEMAKHVEGEPASEELEKEIGDLLFIIVNLARKLGVNPEAALEGTNQKFTDRFSYVETELLKEGVSLQEASEEKMEELWLKAKAIEQGC